MTTKRFRASLALALLGPAVLLGCNKGASTSGAGEGQDIRLGYLVKQPEEKWFQNAWKFAQQAADQYGFRLYKIGAEDGEKVLSAIDNLASNGAQGFVVCTPDVKLGPAIVAKDNANKMKVYSVDDQFVGPDGQFMDGTYMGISARKIGEQVGQALYDEFKKRGWSVEETGAMALTFDELNTVKERTDGAADALAKAGFPATRIYRGAQRKMDVPNAMDAAQVVLTQHPEVKRWLIFSTNDEGVIGAVRALEGRGKSVDDMIGIGIGGSPFEEFKKPKPTGFYATVMISPRRHGFEATENLYKWVKDGVEPSKDIRTEGILVNRENYVELAGQEGLLD